MMTREYWQVAAGDGQREYADYFLRFGLAFVGGKEPLSRLREVREGDVLLLRRGLREILAVGEVVARGGRVSGDGDKEWLRDFDGWDLQGWCNVDWHKSPHPIPATGLNQGTIQRTHKAELRRIADDCLASHPVLVVEPEPISASPVNDEQILRTLVSAGLRIGAADDLTETLRRIRLLARYYYDECEWEKVREHETRTFLVVPLLLALGWAEQQLKIELPCDGGRIDIAGYARPFNFQDSPCTLIVETKGFHAGLTNVHEQAKRYAALFPDCRTLVVTNGYCYKLFSREPGGSFPNSPAGYLNLLHPRSVYPLDPSVPGALKVLTALIPTIP